MYACTCEIGRGFFEGLCRLEVRLITFRDPPPPHQRRRTEAPLLRLRPEEDRVLLYRERRFSLG
jgi:hypothetical protein